MRPILLVGLNARWSHSALGLRCLIANLGDLQPRARLLELTVNHRATDVVEQILGHDPILVGIAVYIWNVSLCTEVVSHLKQVRPDLPVVLGGPEVSFANDPPPLVELADWTIGGEAEHAFCRLCTQVLDGHPPAPGFISAGPPDLASVELPYQLYSSEDIAHRKIYVEASRGCPYGCELCLSSLDPRVRKVPQARLMDAVIRLWDRGVRHFKLVDRALHLAIAPELLELLLDRYEPGTFIHFELVPDHLPARLLEILARFPAGAIQLEAGIQTFSSTVAERIGRHLDLDRCEQNLRHLIEKTGIYIHADLIFGLPGESLDSFAAGFDRLISLNPHEIQVDSLKRLRGTTLPRHDREWSMVYSASPPYQVLQTSTIDFPTMQRLQRFGRYLDLIYNSGALPGTARLVLDSQAPGSPFERFLDLADWLYSATGQTHAIALNRLARRLAAYLVEVRGLPRQQVEGAVAGDFRKAGRKPLPLWTEVSPERNNGHELPKRQRRRVEWDEP
jgi:radical SAM superfamily enzyme YgiQ (UPF0313 family)